MNRTIEAILKLSAKLGNTAAFGQMAAKMAAVDKQAKAFNRTQSLMTRGSMAAATALRSSLMGAAAGAFTLERGYRAVERFAGVERSLTRTGLKLGATRSEMASLGAEMGRIGATYALHQDEVMKIADAYAETGAELKDIKSTLPVLAKSTQAIGAEGQDIVNTWDAARRSFDLATTSAEEFFGVIAAGGAGGKFEGSDLARYLPSLAPVAATQGFTGMEGAARLVGLLEAQRDYVGTSQEAATAVSDLLEKITSPEVEKKFSKMLGKDFRKELAKAKKEGRDVIEVLSELLQKATKGDESRLSEIFGERDSRRAARLIMTQLDEIRSKIEAIEGQSKGLIDKNVTEVLTDAQAKLDKFWATLDRVTTRVGGEAAGPVTDLLDKVDKELSKREAMDQKLKDRGYGRVSRLAVQTAASIPWWINPAAPLTRPYLDRLAFEGGYWPDKGKALPTLAYPTESPSFAPRIPIPTPRPTEALQRWRPGDPMTGAMDFSDGRRPVSGLSPMSREQAAAARAQVMDAGGWANEADKVAQAMRSGGDQAGQAVKGAGEAAGQSMADSIIAAGRTVAAQIGAAIAAGAAKAKAANQPIRANTGQSGPAIEGAP